MLRFCARRCYATAAAAEVSLEASLREAMKAALRAKEPAKTATFKSVLGDIQTASKLPNGASPSKVLAKCIKKRQEALASLPPNLQKQYRSEIDLLLPFAQPEAPVDLKAIEEMVASVLQELKGAPMGAVVKAVKQKLPDAPGKEVALAVKKLFEA